MGSNAHKVGRSARVAKPDLWYFDQLPPTARAALASAERDWSSAWFFNNWRRGLRGWKTGQQLAAHVEAADRRNREKR
jgi:hypothetical protein